MAPTKGSRNRAGSVPPPKAGKRKFEDEPEVPKKRKVQSPRKVDPVETAIEKVCTAVNFELYNQLPPKVVTIVASIAPDALSSTVEERSDLEGKFATLVGDSLKLASTGLTTKASEAAQTLSECEAEVTKLTTAGEEATAVKTGADAAVEAATTEEKAAKEARNTAVVALNTQKDEESKLDETKENLEKERTTLQFALDISKGETPSAKDAKKFAQILTDVGAPEAMVKGAPAAVGKDTELEKMFLDAAIKILDGKMAEVQGKQNDWDNHTSEMAAKTKQMDEEVSALTATHTEKQAALKECKDQQKAAVAGVKKAEKELAEAKKAVEKATEAKEDADKEVVNATEVYGAFEFLVARSSAPAEPEPTEEPEAAPEAPDAADEPMEAPDEPIEAPEAAEAVAAF